METKTVSVLTIARRGRKLYRDRYLYRQWLRITVAMFRSGKHVLASRVVAK